LAAIRGDIGRNTVTLPSRESQAFSITPQQLIRFSVVAAGALLANWRELHGALLRALWKRYRFWGHLLI